MSIDRRTFLTGSAATVLATTLRSPLLAYSTLMDDTPLFRISLAQWSLHRAIFSGALDPLDFPRRSRETFGIEAVEYVNQCYHRTIDSDREMKYVSELKKRADDAGVKSLLMMIDGEGNLGDPDPDKRQTAVENHYKYVEAVETLGGHSIRVNAHSSGSFEEQQKLVADGLRKLCEFADTHEVNVLVENHGGYSSHGQWLAGVMKLVDHPRIGTLPDFGNFCLDWSRRDEPDAWYDRYQGVREMMPWAKAVSAKSHDFDEEGREKHTDYWKMMRIVLDAGYRGYVGVEYEGGRHSEDDGIHKTKALLERVRDDLARERKQSATATEQR